MANKIGQLTLAASGFFWCFLMWFATAAFSPTIADDYGLTLVEIGVLASSALWLAPVGRILAGWASDKFGARNTFTIILLYTGFFSILSAQDFIQANYTLFFLSRVIVASAGISFVVGIQHVAQWFEEQEMGTAQGIYAGTGNAGAGVGALMLPRLYGLDYSSAFLHLGVIALVLAGVYYFFGISAKTKEREETAKKTATLRGTLFVWTRWPAIALMFAYAMSFGLEIAMNAWLPGYYKTGFATSLNDLGFDTAETLQIAVGTFAAVQSFNASLFRPFSGFMSDVWQRKRWMPFPLITKDLPYSPRIHWLMTALICITVTMLALTVAGMMGLLTMSVVILAIFGICVSFGTGSTFAIVPLMFKDRPGTATGFIGGISTAIAIVLPLIWVMPLLDDLSNGQGIHFGYAFVALVIFIPFMIFFMLSFRSSDHPEEHGIGSKEYWVGNET
jgi:NNP family nitrate/nitrite transporter-like MFS transporter